MLAGATLEPRTLILVFSDSMFTPLYLISFQSWSTQERSRPAPPTHTSQPHLIPFSHSRGPQENRLANILCHPNLHPLRAQDGASDLAQLHETPWGGLDLPAPTSRELYRKGLRVTRHLLTIIFPSGLTVIIVQTCLGEKPGGVRGRTHRPGPGSGRLGNREAAAGRSQGVAAPRARGARWLRRSAAPRGGRRGLGAQGRGSARAPGRAVSASPPSPLHILGKARRRAPRSPAARLPARLAGWAGREAPRRADGLPAAGALIPGARALGAG